MERDIIGRIGTRRAGSSNLPRLALYRPDGTLSNTFAADEGREDVAAMLAKAGMVLRDDDAVVRA